METTLKITKESAVKAHEEASAKGKLLLENLFGKSTFSKDIKDVIGNFDDVLRYHGIDAFDFLNSLKGLTEDEMAYRQLKLIVSAYNENAIPDYDDSNQVKYEPRFKLSSSGVGFSYDDCDGWRTLSVSGSRLVYLNYENMKDSVSKFLDIYKKYITNNNTQSPC
ncbi:hypothetical protein [Elizabethkingia ursingii]|uniref:hypothetical protein n=1 Tax=Elizabethkingia ursingii TaxID=1756150 RepID=UPI0007507710|nr:hypothetical protein [Elizabethkingia ursingii]KUY28060.1 hypothetical protein ATB96_19690 [Elizabethkingia ursingii]